MAEIQLFKINESVEELKASSVSIEKDLQNIIEKNMKVFFDVDFLASEFVIDDGRMDSIGIDSNNSPVIFEYKRDKSDSIINQGLFYLNWLKAHKDTFKLLVMSKFEKRADKIDWSMPRVICIANDFNKYDTGAILQMNINIELYRYQYYKNNDLLLFELLGSNTNQLNKKRKFIQPENNLAEANNEEENKSIFLERYEKAPKELREIFDILKDYALSLEDNVTETTLKHYLSLRTIRVFATMRIDSQKIIINLKLDPTAYKNIDKIRNVTDKGHLGIGNLELTVNNKEDIILAKELLEKAYNEN